MKIKLTLGDESKAASAQCGVPKCTGTRSTKVGPSGIFDPTGWTENLSRAGGSGLRGSTRISGDPVIRVITSIHLKNKKSIKINKTSKNEKLLKVFILKTYHKCLII